MKFISLYVFTAVRVYFMVPWAAQEHTSSRLACTRADSIVASRYNSTEYCCKRVQEYTVLWQASTRADIIMASMHKSTHYCGKHVQEHTASLPLCTRTHSIMASMYKSTHYYVEHVEECTASVCMHTSSAINLWGSFDTISGHFWVPHNSQLRLSKHHLPEYATFTALEQPLSSIHRYEQTCWGSHMQHHTRQCMHNSYTVFITLQSS